MPQTSILHVRVDNTLKAEATQTLATFGLTISDAVRILLTRIAKEGSLPPSLTTDPKTHDAWFRAKVHKALADNRQATPHHQVMVPCHNRRQTPRQNLTGFFPSHVIPVQPSNVMPALSRHPSDDPSLPSDLFRHGRA